MPPKGWKRKAAGRANQSTDTRNPKQRSEATHRGLIVANGRLNPANVRRGWTVLRFAWSVAFLRAIVRRKREHARIIASLRTNENVLPSLYKTRQFGASHRAFTSADERRLIRATNDLKAAREGAKAVRRDLRAAESKLALECEAKQELQQQLDVATVNRQKLNEQERRGYKTEWERAKRLRYIKESILPALRLAMAAKPTKSKEHTLQLVRDHIRQVSCWIRECIL
jgi:hypothetical protein